MSSNKSDIALVLDNRVNISSETTGLVRLGGVNTNYFSVQADGGPNYPSQIQWNNIVTPSLTTTMVSRNIRFIYQVQVSCTSVGALPAIPNLTLPKPSYDPSYPVETTFRAFPLQSCCDTVSLLINGATTTINSRQVLSAMTRTIDKEYLKNQATEAPDMADQRAVLVANYAPFSGTWQAAGAFPAGGTVVNVAFSNGMVGTWTAPGAYPAVGTRVAVTITGRVGITAYWVAGSGFVANAVNLVFVNVPLLSEQPLSVYEASQGATRASYQPISYKQNEGGLDIWQFLISEPLLISPLVLHDDEVFLSNINTLSVQLNYSILSDMLCSAGTSGIANSAVATVAISGITPQLQLTYIQVDPSVVSIPRMSSYHFENITYFPQIVATGVDLSVDNFFTTPVVSQTIRFQTLPSTIYVFVRQAKSQTALGTGTGRAPDVFLPFGDNAGKANMSIQIGTRTGLLASATTKTIYRLSKRNGYNSSWNDYNQGSGGLLVLNPALDLGVNIEAGDVVSGEMASNVNFQISLQVNNANYLYTAGSQAERQALGVPTSANLELMIVAVYSGTANITPDGCLFNLGEYTTNEISTLVRTAPKDGSMVSSEAIAPTIQGRGLFSKFKSILGQTASGVKSVISNPAFQKGLEMASSLKGKGLRRM